MSEEKRDFSTDVKAAETLYATDYVSTEKLNTENMLPHPIRSVEKLADKHYPCIESTLDLDVNIWKIRVWREEKSVDYMFVENGSYLKDLIKEKAKELGFPALLHFIAEQPRVNAVQIINTMTGQGCVIYTEWP